MGTSDRKALFEVKRLANQIFKAMDRQAKQQQIDELAMMHGFVLHHLYLCQGQDVFQKDIEKYFSISRSNVTAILKALEKGGLVVRESVEHDARLKKVILTEKGLKSELALNGIIERMDHQLTEGIDPDEFRIFMKVCDQMENNILKYNERSDKT